MITESELAEFNANLRLLRDGKPDPLLPCECGSEAEFVYDEPMPMGGGDNWTVACKARCGVEMRSLTYGRYHAAMLWNAKRAGR